MKTQLLKTLMVAVLVLCGSTAQAQAPTDDCPYPWAEIVDCTTATDDPICDFQKQNGLATSGRCDRAMALKLAEKFPATQGAWTTVTDAQAWAICSATGPRRNDNKCGWFRIVDEATPGGSDEDPIQIVAKNLKDRRKAVTDAEAALLAVEKAEGAYRGEVEVGLDVSLKRLDWIIFGAMVGGTNVGGMVGGTAALHIPCGRYRSGVEIGGLFGYGGWRLDPGQVHLLAETGPFVQGFIEPWKRFGFVLGAEGRFRLPNGATDPTTILAARLGIRGYVAERFALELVGRPGLTLENGDVAGAASGAEFSALVHF